jgi:hypothetical protein
MKNAKCWYKNSDGNIVIYDTQDDLIISGSEKIVSIYDNKVIWRDRDNSNDSDFQSFGEEEEGDIETYYNEDGVALSIDDLPIVDLDEIEDIND